MPLVPYLLLQNLAASQITPVDPDWLLSSTVQSAAVLVAIVGGFLVSRLVTLSAERGALIQRRNHRDELRSIKQDTYDTVHADRLAVSTEWFVEHHRPEVLAKLGKIDPGTLLADFIPRGSSAEEMRPVAEELVNSTETAFTDILYKFPKNAPPPQTCSELRDLGVEVPEGSEAVYETVADYIARKTSQQARRDYQLSNLISPPALTPPIVYERQDARISKEADLASDVRELDKGISLLDEELSEVEPPPS